MSTKQPVWKVAGRVGDVNPIDHCGGFIYIDETGVYPPEVEYIDAPTEFSGEPWKIYRFILEPCTYINGVLSDNKHHPNYAVWFSKDLMALAEFIGGSVDELIHDFTEGTIKEKAAAWLAVGDYHGYDNLDSYPLVITNRAEVEVRYAEELLGKQTTKGNK